MTSASRRTNEEEHMNVLRWPQLKEVVGLSRSTVWRLEQSRDFPQRVKLSAGAVGWIRQEVEEWLRRKTDVGREPTSGSDANAARRGRC
jgi:prophage regulatory protein